MWHVRRWLLLLAAMAAILATASPAPAQVRRTPEQLWSDFNHYVLIARPELAAASGETLLDRTEPEGLLDAVEQDDYVNWKRTLQQATETDEVKDVAQRLGNAIAEARLARAKNPQRIRRNIERLAEGQQAYTNAITRLRAAGQVAIPSMIEVLTDRNQQQLRPYVTTALVAMGRPAVYPLAVALPHVDGPTKQRLARVLADIGYPMPLPFLKHAIERRQTDDAARKVLERAYAKLAEARGVDFEDDAAGLFRQLAADQYDTGQRGELPGGYQVTSERGMVWRYNATAGLVAIPVPRAIFADVLAMQSARFALELNPDSSLALRLWLMSNLRRGLRLPDGEADPTYGADRRPPSFYALLAGPEQLLSILARAVNDRDAGLALAALDNLDHTAATDALIVNGAAVGPLLRAMSYPVRGVRFEAAAVLADARPQSRYDGSELVVPALAEAVRTAAGRYALVLAESDDRAAALASDLRALGFVTASGATLPDVRDTELVQRGVDLILADLPALRVGTVLERLAGDLRLGATPIVAAVNPAERVTLQERARDEPRLTVIAKDPEAQSLRDAIEAARSRVAGEQLTEEQATERALRALRLLRDVGVSGSVYDLSLAESSLIPAIRDDRDAVATAAADVVAMLDSAKAQRALLAQALEAGGDRRVAMLNALADSATRVGNRLTEGDTDELAVLIRDGRDAVALAAARAHGALQLPAQRAVDQIFAE